MITKSLGRLIVHMPRARHTYPASIPHYLFFIEDGRMHYDAQVEHDHVEEEAEEVPKQDDEVEQEEESPEQEKQPHRLHHVRRHS
jgi:hypothetical protein